VLDDLFKISKDIRKDIISSLVPKESHHIGSSMSIVDILVYLYYIEMKIYPKDPKNENRDIFILSKGHGTLALYAVLCKREFFCTDLLATYDKNGGILSEHANVVAPGVELSTGSLGHGLPVGVGFATSLMNDNPNRRVIVLMSDGEFNEGSNWEAIMYAGFHKLKNLIIIADMNGFQGYGTTKKVLDLGLLDKKLTDFNWETYDINGHNFQDLSSVFLKIKKSHKKKPKIIFANTVKGKGVPFFEGKFESHYKSLDESLIKEILLSM
jgi:transketolase